MKAKYFMTFVFVLSALLPMKSSAEVDANLKTRINVSSEQRIDIKRPALGQKLWQEKVADKKAEFQKAREAFLTANQDRREELKMNFRGVFVERFEFAYRKLSEFQTRLDARLEKEAMAGVDTSKAEIKLKIGRAHV